VVRQVGGRPNGPFDTVAELLESESVAVVDVTRWPFGVLN
jgi:hypothetical protein